MSIVPPNIEGDLTQFTTIVRLTNQGPSNTVELVMRPARDAGPETIVLSTPARMTDEYFTLSSALVAGHWVSARQRVGPYLSSTSRPKQVKTSPPNPSTPYSRYRTLYACAKCVVVVGYSGADITINHYGRLYGPEKVPSDGLVEIALGNRLGIGDQLEIIASLPTGSTTGLTLPAFQPPTIGPLTLPPPSIPALREGQELLRVNDILLGAKVSLFFNGASYLSIPCSAYAALLWEVGTLVKGQTWAASQDYDECQMHSPQSPPVTVIDDPLGAPTLGPVCETYDAKYVVVEVRDLIAEAWVQFHWIGTDGTDGYFNDVRASGAINQFTLPALGAGTLAVQQGLPNVAGVVRWSPFSSPPTKVQIIPSGSTGTSFIVEAPLYKCGNAVRVESFPEGSEPEITVYSVLYGVIGKGRFKYNHKLDVHFVDIPVSPLTVGDSVFAGIESCGIETLTPVIVVRPLPVETLMPPTPDSFVRGRMVDVFDVVPGAIVELSHNKTVIPGTATGSGGNYVTIEVPGFITLTRGDQIHARQSLCGVVTALSTRYAYVS